MTSQSIYLISEVEEAGPEIMNNPQNLEMKMNRNVWTTAVIDVSDPIT